MCRLAFDTYRKVHHPSFVSQEKGPKYRLIASDLQGRIRSGNLRPGDKLPTLRFLADSYDVTIETASRAVSYVADRGMVITKQGAGSYVAGESGKKVRARSPEDTISVLVPDELLTEDDGTPFVTNYWIEAVVSALTRSCGRNEVKSQLIGFPPGPIYDHGRWSRSLSGSLGAVVIGDPDDSVLNILRKSETVTCLINRQHPESYEERFFSVLYGTQALRSLANYVISLGHRRILFAQDVEPRHHNPVAALRRSIYEEVLREWGGTPETDLRTVYLSVDPLKAESNVETLEQNLSSGFTAAVCYNDASAIAMYGAAQTLGVEIPTQFTVVGHDGLPVSKILSPPLTTIAYDNFAMCSVVLRTIMDASHGKLPPQEPIVFEGSLLIRRSATVPPVVPDTSIGENQVLQD